METVKFAKKILLFIPILFVVIGFNYFIDPLHIFKTGSFYEDVVRILLTGKNVANLHDRSARLLKKEYIRMLPKRNEIIVLGSSRVLHIDSSLFPGNSFFNNGVTCASIADDMAIYWMYRKKGFIPSVVVIGLDPWLLNKFNKQMLFDSRPIVEDYQQIMAYINDRDYPPSYFARIKYFELISPVYFQLSFQYWMKSMFDRENGSDRYYPTSKNIANVEIQHADGSITYGKKDRNSSLQTIRLSAIADASNNESIFLDKFTQLDPELINKFDKFINLLIRDKVKIVFFLSPFHPAAYPILEKSDKYKIIIEVQKYFEEYAHDKGIKLLGSYNPGDCSVREADFYDMYHLKESGIDIIFKPKKRNIRELRHE